MSKKNIETLPSIDELIYFPYLSERNIKDNNGHYYYYYELLDMGFKSDDLNKIKKSYDNILY